MTQSKIDLVSRGPSSKYPGSNEHMSSTVTMRSDLLAALSVKQHNAAPLPTPPWYDKVGKHRRHDHVVITVCSGDGSNGDTRATAAQLGGSAPRHILAKRRPQPPWGAVGARPNLKVPNRRVSMENEQSHHARGGALITTICLEFYGDIGKTPNRRALLQTGSFSPKCCSFSENDSSWR